MDILVSIKDNRISTAVYCKPTDTHQHLDSKSCHPSHVKNGVPYGQSLRVRRICNSDEVFDKRLKELKGHFVKRSFKKNMIENQFEKAKAKRREDLLYQDTNRNKQVKRMSLVVNFHPALSGIGKIRESLWQSYMYRKA